MNLDILIKGGNIIDGTGKDMYKADIGIKDDKIVEIGNIENCKASKVIDANDLMITPGFIDVHSHADCTILQFPKAESCVMQGVTTVVGGNCGFSPAPLKDKWVMQFWEFDIWDDINPNVFGENTIQPLDKAKEVFEKRLGYKVDWSTFKEFLDRIDNNGLSINLVPLVGHCQIRAQVMGNNCARSASNQEIDEMKSMVKEAMEAGAFGVSSGLSYMPGVFSTVDELTEVVGIAAEYGGIYSTHFNRVDLKARKGTKIRGIEEAIEIGRRTKAKVQISHIYNGYDIYPEPSSYMIKATAKATLDVIDRAADDGVQVAFDVIPNIDGGIAMPPSLMTLVYSWYKQSGSVEQFLKNLKADDYRNNIKEYIRSGKWGMLNPAAEPDWDAGNTILKCSIREYEGKTLRTIANEKGIDPLDLIFDILSEDPYTKIKGSVPGLYEEAIKVFLEHPKAMACSDTFALDDKGIYGMSEPAFVKPHPNTYNVFIRYITQYGQQRLEDTIRKITGFPAEWIGLKDRGVIREGAKADIVIIDNKKLKSNEDYIEPRKHPEGIKHVLVNGKIVVSEGIHTGVKSGMVIRKNN